MKRWLMLVVFIVFGANQVFGQLPKFLTYPMEQDPIPGITSGWWYDTDEEDSHSGVDYDLDEGSKVAAAAGGVIDDIINQNQNYYDPQIGECSGGMPEDWYGTYVIIDHGNDYKTLYAHLQYETPDLYIEKGQRVERGQVIGISGNTGCSSGDHLHFEIRGPNHSVTGLHDTNYNGIKYDPYAIYSGIVGDYTVGNTGSNRLWTTNPPSRAQYLSPTYAHFNGRLIGMRI